MGRTRRLAASPRLLALAGAVGLCLLLAGGPIKGPLLTGALYLLPAVVLALALLAGRYPGERALRRLREARAPRRPRPASSPAPRRRHVEIAHGGRLIATSLAGRAPPCAAGCC